MTLSRKIPLQGAFNFKEMGGIPNKNNQVLKWRMLFRSDNLDNISEKDRFLLSTFNIGNVIDLRMPFEKSKNNYFPHIKYYSIPMVNINVKNMQDFYTSLLYKFTQQLQKIFRILLQSSDQATLIHCNLGKDRTGMVIAIILMALEVSDYYIYQDYLESNHNLKSYWPIRLGKLFGLAGPLRAKSINISSAMETIERDYNDFNTYLERVLMLDAQDIIDLKRKFLHDDPVNIA